MQQTFKSNIINDMTLRGSVHLHGRKYVAIVWITVYIYFL